MALKTIAFSIAVCGLGLTLSGGTSAEPMARFEGVRLPCGLTAGSTHTVVAIETAKTLSLDSGETVHLNGVLAPFKPLAFRSLKTWRAERAALQGLKSLVLNKQVIVAHRGGEQKDRYGRTLAHLFVREAGRLIWIERQMIASGHARASLQTADQSCLKDLLDAERQARRSQLGLWSDRFYQVYRLDETTAASEAELLKRRHQFQIVEGRIRDVAVVRGMIYLNFGANWRSDFTAALSKAALKSSGGTVDQLEALKGPLVPVRGWIERRNGPYIQLSGHNDIEKLEPDDASAATSLSPPATTNNDDLDAR